MALSADWLPPDCCAGAGARWAGFLVDALLACEFGVVATDWRYLSGGCWLWAGGSAAGTSTLNAAGAERGGVASAVVTAARMIGMILGLAALTSWGLARFKQLSAAYTFQQLNAPGVLNNVLHQVYTEIFLGAAILCLLAIIPAALLWRRDERPRSLVLTHPAAGTPIAQKRGEQPIELEGPVDANTQSDLLSGGS